MGDFALRGALGDVHSGLFEVFRFVRGDEGAFGLVWVELFGFFAEGSEEVGLGDRGFYAEEVCGGGF